MLIKWLKFINVCTSLPIQNYQKCIEFTERKVAKCPSAVKAANSSVAEDKTGREEF